MTDDEFDDQFKALIEDQMLAGDPLSAALLEDWKSAIKQMNAAAARGDHEGAEGHGHEAKYIGARLIEHVRRQNEYAAELATTGEPSCPDCGTVLHFSGSAYSCRCGFVDVVPAVERPINGDDLPGVHG